MSSKPERERGWLEDIVENIDRISGHIAGLGFEAFEATPILTDAVERCIERITEAAIRIGPERMREIAPDLPLHQLRGLGNRLRHEYDRIDPRIIWSAVKDELPPLREACERALG